MFLFLSLYKLDTTGKDLLYLVDLPIIDGPATCQPMNSFNPLALKVLRSHQIYIAHLFMNMYEFATNISTFVLIAEKFASST